MLYGLYKEAFRTFIHTNVESITENFENIGAGLRKSPSPALVEEILKLETFKDIEQHIVSTTVTESRMTIKYLKDESTMLAVVSAVREVDFDHMNYARHNTYSIYIHSTEKDLITNWYDAANSWDSFSTIH